MQNFLWLINFIFLIEWIEYFYSFKILIFLKFRPLKINIKVFWIRIFQIRKDFQIFLDF